MNLWYAGCYLNLLCDYCVVEFNLFILYRLNEFKLEIEWI